MGAAGQRSLKEISLPEILHLQINLARFGSDLEQLPTPGYPGVPTECAQ